MSTTKTDGGDAVTDTEETITIGESADGEPVTLPIVELLTGRAFITGKSGSGKSNSASVVTEELLEAGYPVLIVDTDGEYYGLKEQYEILHAGADEQADIQVGPEHAGRLAQLALEDGVPIILDVSGYLDEDVADELIRETARELFTREKELKTPFLLVVEEIHEYIPEGGSLDAVGKMLIKISKRGRKHGLGIAGISQRPADVKKDFITQANWLLWHRLTWDNDTTVVRRVVSSDAADAIGDLADGEAFLQADWRDADLERVQVRRKRTFDAGATPGLEDVERPDLKSLDEDLLGELEEISDRADQRRDEIERLQEELEQREDRIADLEDELENQQNIADAAQQMADALANGSDTDAVPEDFDAQIEAKNERIHDLESRLEDVIDERDQLRDRVDDLEHEVDRLQVAADRIEQAEQIEQQLDRAREVLGAEVETTAPSPAEETVDSGELERLRERVEELEAENERLRGQSDGESDDLGDLIDHGAVQTAVDVAKDNADRAGEHFDRALAVLASSDGGPLHASEIEPLMEGVSTDTVNAVLRSLFDAGVVQREKDGRKYKYALDRGFLERRIEVAEQQRGT
ncbi:helicase HerA domain-containing protein [Natrinema pallidum]|uniref:helicase HerA domain-containing protein n=1 Tax=Natrinema pallidum TaxID=69527 RepID=UPI00375143FB